MFGGVKHVPVRVNYLIVRIKGDWLDEFKPRGQPESFNLRTLGCQSDHYHQQATPNQVPQP